ncbi:MAG: hypothetical protein NT126_02340 [Bacteroidetes bacterium]|nr:hypothetical protein [Bacteroidota bacterium]
MLKDIPQLVVENIIIAVVKEPGDDGEWIWNVYLVNLYNERIEGVLVSSKGYGNFEGRDVRTTVLRHLIGELDPQDYAKIEPIMTDVFGLSNEYWVSFYLNKKMYDKKYIFLPESIKEENFSVIPVLKKKGVMIR